MWDRISGLMGLCARLGEERVGQYSADGGGGGLWASVSHQYKK